MQALHLGDRASALTHSLTGRVSALEGRLSHALTDNLHSLQDSFQHNPFLHRVSDGVHSVSHALSGNLHSIQDTVHAVQGSLQQGLHAVESQLQSSAAHFGSNLVVRASGLQAALRQQLRPIVQWPTPRWPVSMWPCGTCRQLMGGWGAAAGGAWDRVMPPELQHLPGVGCSRSAQKGVPLLVVAASGRWHGSSCFRCSRADGLMCRHGSCCLHADQSASMTHHSFS